MTQELSKPNEEEDLVNFFNDNYDVYVLGRDMYGCMMLPKSIIDYDEIIKDVIPRLSSVYGYKPNKIDNINELNINLAELKESIEQHYPKLLKNHNNMNLPIYFCNNEHHFINTEIINGIIDNNITKHYNIICYVNSLTAVTTMALKTNIFYIVHNETNLGNDVDHINWYAQRGIHFKNTIFLKNVSFSRHGFDNITFHNVIFNGKADFSQCTFNGIANFSSSTFNGEAIFYNITFSGKTDFKNTTFNGEAYFDILTFNGEANFENTTFNAEAVFFKSIFNGEAVFSKSTFNAEVKFYESTFKGKANFSQSNFNGEAVFYSSNFDGEAVFYSSNFNGEAVFYSSNFDGEAVFYSSNFNGIAYFNNNTTFKGEANFSQSTFNGVAYFHGPTFNAEANFSQSNFNGEAVFLDSTFKGNADFHRTTFKSYANFSQSNFNDKVSFQNTIFNSKANFYWCDFEKKAKFNKTIFKKNAIFEGTHFKDKAYFENITCEENTQFEYVTFDKFASFAKGNFVKNVIFDKSEAHETLTFDNAQFGGAFSIVGIYTNRPSFLGIKVGEFDKQNNNEFKPIKFNKYFDNLLNDNLLCKDPRDLSIQKDKMQIPQEDFRRSCDIIKNSLDNMGQRADANIFFALGLLAKEQEKLSGRGERFVLRVNKKLSNHGQNWLLPIVWIVGILLLVSIFNNLFVLFPYNLFVLLPSFFVFFPYNDIYIFDFPKYILFNYDKWDWEPAKTFAMPTYINESVLKNNINECELQNINKDGLKNNIVWVLSYTIVLKGLFGLLVYQLVNALRFRTKR